MERTSGIIVPRAELVDLILRGKSRLHWEANGGTCADLDKRKAQSRFTELLFGAYQQQSASPEQPLRELLMSADQGVPKVDITIKYDESGNELERPIIQAFGLPLNPCLEALSRAFTLSQRDKAAVLNQSFQSLTIAAHDRGNVWHWLAYELWENAGGYDHLTNFVNAGDLIHPKNRIVQFKS